MNPEDRPILRALDVKRIEHEGAPCFLLTDPTRVSEAQLIVPVHLGAVLARCTGELTLNEIVAEIHAEIEATYGAGAPTRDLLATYGSARVRATIETLARAGMLEDETFAQLQAAALRAYRAQPYRAPALAGAGYPARARQMWRLLQDYLEAADNATDNDADEDNMAALDWQRGVALLSPHIDYARGGAVYAQVWKRMAQAARVADIAIILGTDHYGDDPFTLTRQNYWTPFGVLPTEQEVTSALADAIGTRAAFAGELRHRGEHSLELVVNWLHHMREGEALPIVPMLTGSLQRYMRNGSQPAEDAQINGVLEVLRSVSKTKRVLLIASGDLAHVGPAFGGAPLDAAALGAQTAADQSLLQQMQQGGAQGFFEAIKRVQNRSNVCGVAPIYLALRALSNGDGATPSGSLAGYAVCPADDAGTSVVTIAGMHFHG